MLLASCGAHTFHGQLIDTPTAALDFTMTDQNGQPFQLSAQRGKLVALFFGFTHCPDICPTTLADMKAIRQQLGGDAEKFQVVFVSIDPERDTPELVNRYVTAFDPSFVGLSGPQTTLDPLYQAYGVTAIKREIPNSALGYTMDHSTYVYIIDPAGRYRMVFPYDMPIDDIVSDLRYLIKNN
jgi:protein SCO1/2